MTAVGIIAEYNPFHNGHLWHLKTARHLSGCPYVVAVMSGNFVQRGEPAIFDKWLRAEWAVRSGVDLVLELPVVFSVRSAQFFASGGIRLLKELGIISHLCFGSESDDLVLLQHVAGALNSANVVERMKDNLNSGLTYAAALANAINAERDIPLHFIKSPNNILAFEYLRALHKFAPEIKPIAIRRKIAQYHDKEITSMYASATAIRKELHPAANTNVKIKLSIPAVIHQAVDQAISSGRGPITLQDFSQIILANLRMAKSSYIEQIPDVSEGLHNKIYDEALKAINISTLLDRLKTKRYTLPRLQRILVHSLLGTEKQTIAMFDDSGPLYIRVLAFNNNGRKLLSIIKRTSRLPLITKTAQYYNTKLRDDTSLSPLCKMLASDTIAGDLYALAMPNLQLRQGGWDFRHSPVYIHD